MIEIDARGMRCPWPVLRLARAIRQEGAVPLALLSDDPRASAEVAALVAGKPWRLSEREEGSYRRFQLDPITDS